MTIERIAGFVLLCTGVVIILFGLYSGFKVFTGADMPPELFKPVEQEAQAPAQSSNEVQLQIQALFQEQAQSFLDPKTMPTIMNLTAWSIFLGILVLGGGQIAGIGVKLLKK